MLTYMIGYRPDEFGLVPDAEGFVRYKDLLKAFHEEEGWHHVRRSHLNEMLMGEDRALFETENDRIRSLDRHWVLDPAKEAPLPGLLFSPVRKKAHAVVMEEGLSASPGAYIPLSPDREMALRMGRRRDHQPVLLEIPAALAEKEGLLIFPFGDLFLAPKIPARCISGPLPQKALLERAEKKEDKRDKPRFEPENKAYGSFVLDPLKDPDPSRRVKGKKQKGWKEASRKLRRQKGG